MGYYINHVKGESLPAKGKAKFLIEKADAQIVHPTSFQENLVCILDNGIFEAAGYAYSPDEFKEFARNDGRRKIWLEVPNAKELAK